MPGEKQTFGTDPSDLFRIVMLIGAVIGAVSLFQTWFSMDFVFFRIDYAGYDFYLRSLSYPSNFPSIGYYAYMPFAVFIASAAGVAVSALTFTKHWKKGAVAGFFLGCVIVISALLYVFYPVSEMAFSTPGFSIVWEIRLMDYLGSGAYSAVTAGILLLLGGLLLMVRKKAAPGA